MTSSCTSSRPSSSWASASAAQLASLSTYTGSCRRSRSTSRSGTSRSGQVDARAHAAGCELDRRGHPETDRLHRLLAEASLGPDRDPELGEQTLGVLGSRWAPAVGSESVPARRRATAIFVPPTSTPMTVALTGGGRARAPIRSPAASSGGAIGVRTNVVIPPSAIALQALALFRGRSEDEDLVRSAGRARAPERAAVPGLPRLHHRVELLRPAEPAEERRVDRDGAVGGEHPARQRDPLLARTAGC